MKVLTFARRIARGEGIIKITNRQLDYLMWERTGYPHFWATNDPIKEFETQLRQAFMDIKSGKSKEWT